MRIKMQSILYGLFALMFIGIQLQKAIAFFSPTVNKVLGAMMVAVLIIIIAGNKDYFHRIFNAEMILWIIFLLWSGLTGFFVAKVTSTFSNLLFYLAQQTLVVMGGILITIIYGSVKRVMYVVFLVPLVFVVYLLATGQGHYIFSLTTSYGSNYLGKLLNANTIAFWNISGIIAYCVFRTSLVKKRARIFCLLASVLYFYMIIQSGSRKNFLAAVLFIVLAYLTNHVFVKKSSAAKTIGILSFVFVAYISLDYLLPEILADTYLGKRLLNFANDASNEKRLDMIIEALGYFAQSPLWGIGINQFQHYSIYGYYSHCDIAEVLCSTGLIGGLLYVSIYILCFFKLFRIWNYFRNNGDRRCKQTGAMLAALTAMMFLSLGNVAFQSLTHWVLMSTVIGYTQLYGRDEFQQRKVRVQTGNGNGQW